MNGHLLPILLAIIGGLLGLVQLLFGIILKLHKDHDDERIEELKNHEDERIKYLKDEVDRIREKLHEWAPQIGWIDQQRRLDGKNRRGE